MTITLTLPFPPSANRLWTRAFVGRTREGLPKRGMRKTDEYTAWLKAAGWEAKAQRQKPISGPYRLSIHASRPDKRRRDIDNLIKSTSDLLQAVRLVGDDSDCEMVSARWVTSGEGITVIVEPAAVEGDA